MDQNVSKFIISFWSAMRKFANNNKLDIMKKYWVLEPNCRPSFQEIQGNINEVYINRSPKSISSEDHGHLQMSPQTVVFDKFSMASDVWSVAMTMWNFAMQPYFGLTNEEIIEHIHDGRISWEKKADW